MGINQGVARLAIVAGVVAITADVAFLIFMIAGEPFGSVNDVANGAFAIMAGWLAWTLRDRAGGATAAVALVGAAVGVVGSWLVLSGTTGWFLAGLVSAVGFALIGPSVIAVGRSVSADGRWPGRLAPLVVASGALMLFGVLALPGIAMRLDDANTAPGWIWLAFLGWLGAFVLYPAWAIWIGRVAGGRREVPLREGATG